MSLLFTSWCDHNCVSQVLLKVLLILSQFDFLFFLFDYLLLLWNLHHLVPALDDNTALLLALFLFLCFLFEFNFNSVLFRLFFLSLGVFDFLHNFDVNFWVRFLFPFEICNRLFHTLLDSKKHSKRRLSVVIFSHFLRIEYLQHLLGSHTDFRVSSFTYYFIVDVQSLIFKISLFTQSFVRSRLNFFLTIL